MSNEPAALTATNLTAAAEDCLLGRGYARVGGAAKAPGQGRFYEDGYGIVLVSVFDTFAELDALWPECQAVLVDLISANLSKSEPKAWDGYLVLFTPSSAPGGREAVEAIRYDTSRVRKLLADGEELRTIAAVEETLLPLLPLEVADELTESPSVLELLPDLLAERGVESQVARALVAAFAAGDPLVEALHRVEGEG